MAVVALGLLWQRLLSHAGGVFGLGGRVVVGRITSWIRSAHCCRLTEDARAL